MKFKRFAYIFLMPGFSEEEHTAEMSHHEFGFKTVGIDIADRSKVLPLAKTLVAEGYQMIELCGGFGPEWIFKVREAIQDAIPVGGVFYGPEARKPLVDLLT